MNKLCKKCNQTKDIREFHKDGNKKDGYSTICKECRIKYATAYREDNFDKIKKAKAMAMSKKPEFYTFKKHEWYLHNKEQHNQKGREYYKINHDKMRKIQNKYNVIWQKENKAKMALYRHKRRSLAKEMPCNFNKLDWEKLKLLFNDKCAYCGSNSPLTVEHFIALSKGGEYTINNILPICKTCNSSKCNRDFFEWYPNQIFYSKAKETKILKHLNYTKQGKTQQLSLII